MEWSAKLGFEFALLIGFLTGTCIVSAQYPSQSQISKDGTAVLLEDYVNLPLSSPTHGGKAPGETDFKGQLGRVTSLRSEPADGPAFLVGYCSAAALALHVATRLARSRGRALVPAR